MCIVGWEGMLLCLFGFMGGVVAGGGEVMFMCLLFGIEGVCEREVGVWGVEWMMMCWGCCVVWEAGLGGVRWLMGFFG